MKFVAAIGLVLFQASLYSCRTHNSVSLAHDASAEEQSVVSPMKATKLTQLIPILESLDSPDTKITKIKRLIPIYSELNKWKIRNKKQLVEILPLKKKGKPLAIILSGQPSYGTNERHGKQNVAEPYELSSREETENDSEEWNHRGISDHHTDIHKSHSLNLHKNHSNHSHEDKITQKNNLLEHRIFATNFKNGESKHRYSDSESVDDIMKNSIELHQGHHSNHVHKKSYLDFDSHSYESDSNSNETDFYRHLTKPVQHYTHTASPKHSYHQEVANSYIDSNEFDNNIDSTESGPLELDQRQSHISKHNHNHHLKNKDIGSDSASDSTKSDSADSVLVPIELESNEETLDSVFDASSESNESNIRLDLSESDFESISYPELYESNLNNKKFDLQLYSETSESISDSKSEELFESDLISDPLFTESNRAINSNSDDSSGDYSESYLKSHALVGSDSESMSYLISSEFLSGSQTASSETLFETSESAVSSESNFDSSASISAASVSESKSTESHSKTTESFPESLVSFLDTSDSSNQSNETNIAYRTFSGVRDFISESKEIRESSVSGLGSSESALESSESTLGSSESTLGSSESTLGSSESTLGSSEPTLDNSESTLGSSESYLESSESTIESSEPALESNESILESSESTLVGSESTLESSELNLETSEFVSKINESSSKYSESNKSSESVSKSKSALESSESDFYLESSETSSEPCQTKLKSKESLESEVSQLQTSPQITDSRRHNCGDGDHKSSDFTPFTTAAQKEVGKLSRGKKTYRLSFVFNK